MTATPAPRGSVAWVARAVQVRLRFVIVLAVTCLVVGRWETLRTYWDKAARAALGEAPAEQAVSSDTEYFCPMDPGVVTDWPGRCGVCNMALVRRKRGEATPLPSGVVARMQLSPERLQLAGVRTATVTYRPLTRELHLVGMVKGDSSTVEADVFDKDLPLLAPGLAAEVVDDGPGGAETFAAKVRDIILPDPPRRAPARAVVEVPGSLVMPGKPVTVRVRRPVADFEPFRSLPSDPPPPRKGEPRAVYLCPAHAEVLRDAPGKCPVDGSDTLERRPLASNQRVGWWCPMHPSVTADQPGPSCKECGGMALAPRVVTYRPAGQVLAVDGSAVVDTGARTVVFVERMPGMFDGVAVTLGPRCGDAYPVASGLEPGQRVATSGAFLLDAETRLNPGLAASYFGARVAGAPAPTPTVEQPLCPVTGKPLGSMGPPVRVVVDGRAMMLCCDGCEAKLRKDPDRYMPKKP